MPWWLDDFQLGPTWDSVALVKALSALLDAHSRLKKPSSYQRALLLQASAQLASHPCALIF